MRESEDKYRELIESVYDWIWEVDVNNVYTYSSPRSYDVLGYRPEELIGRHSTDFMTPEESQRVRSILGVAFANRAPITHHAGTHIHRDGHTVWVEVNALPIFDRDETFRGYRGIIRDITDRKQAEEAMREKDAIMQAFFDGIAESMILTDRAGVILAINATAAQRLGCSPEAAVGSRLYDLLGDRAEGKKAWADQVLRTGKAVRFEDTCSGRTIDQTIFPILTPDGKISRFAIFGQDVTKHKRTEETLRDVSSYLENLINYANAPIIVWDPGFRITRFNHAFEHLTGYRSEEVVGRELDMLFPSDSREESLLKIKRTLTGEHWESVEIPILRKDGGIKIALWNSANVYDSEGKALLATIAQGQDITERKWTEDELAQSKAEAELYLDLMGHDINNMHQVALGYLEFAEELEDNEVMKDLLARPRDVLLRSARLIDNVRKLQKLRNGAYQSMPVELVKILSDVLREYEVVPGKTLTLDTHHIKFCYVLANELLYDVFSNLVSNAIKYSGSHARVTISLESLNESGREFYRVSIEDNGPGIADSFKQKVFNRMLRGEAGAKGMGLGLYIVKSLVDSYGGRVWVEDRVPGDHMKGAKFVVLLRALYKN